MKDIILTGIRSNDEPTLGNYLGAMRPMADLQRKFAGRYQINMFVPDLHSFTTPIDHSTLYDSSIRNLKYFVAAGLDIDDPNTFIYRQSFIPAHSELTVILNNFTGFGEMARMTQFKDKSAAQNDNVSVGLFDYPVLMAADILLYGAKYVPVGEDQTQHLEITRDIGLRMNHKFGELFVIPEETKKQVEFMNLNRGLRIRSLSDPTRKMSKSIQDPRGTILLSDSPDAAAKKVMSATTDSVGQVNFDWENQPGVTNLLQILVLLTGRPQDEINAEWTGQTSYGELKKAVATAVRDFLTDFQTKLGEIDESRLLDKLSRDEMAMAEVANETLLRVQRAVGLRQKK
ncbi:tryptophan--tRNA ligase [Candidatus Saccharibacteria bacterium]|nr:tryptophan--tRNA ligase [Candidatus Saccharibacteria bacterium]